MKNIFIIISLFVCTSVFAQNEPGKITVQSMNDDVDLSILDSKLYDKRNRLPKNSAQKNLPLPVQIEEYIKSANLQREVANYDQLDKDILFRKARKYKIEKLKKHYKQIEESKLKKFKEVVDTWEK